MQLFFQNQPFLQLLQLLQFLQLSGHSVLNLILWIGKKHFNNVKGYKKNDKQNYLFTNKTKLFVKYSHHQVKSKIKKSLSKCIYWMCVIKAIIYSTFGIACLPFLKSVITSLFIWLFREGTIILIKYASKIFCSEDVSYHVASRLTNIPVKETIEYILHKIYIDK